MLTIIIRRPTRWRGLELQAGQVVTAPISMADVVAQFVSRGYARAADDQTRRILRDAAAALLG